jgi:hypothetical protein
MGTIVVSPFQGQLCKASKHCHTNVRLNDAALPHPVFARATNQLAHYIL